MGRAFALARVAVLVRAAARWWWWLGVVTALVGAFVPGLVGRRIGLLGGAAAFVVAGVVACFVGWRRYVKLANASTRAGKAVVLQDRAVSVRAWRRRRRWWTIAVPLVSLLSSLVAPATLGLLLAGVGAGLRLKAVRLGRWERANESLLWVRPEHATRGPAGSAVTAYLTTGPAAGDARPGGSPRRTLAAH